MTLEKLMTALLNMGPCACEYGHICPQESAKCSKRGVFLQHKLHVAFLARPEPPGSTPARKYRQQRRNRGKQWAPENVEKGERFENVRNVSVLDEEDCQKA